MNHRSPSILLAAHFIAAAACGQDPDAALVPASVAAPALSIAPLAASAVLHHDGPTNDHVIAVENMSGQISQIEKMIAQRPKDAALIGNAVGLLLERSRLTGSLVDRERAFALSQRPLVDSPDKADAALLAASGLAAVHRFEDALAKIDLADTLKPLPGETTASRSSVLAALGRYDEALALSRPGFDARPSSSNLLTYAVLLSKMGKIDEAEQRFVEAEKKFRGISPFALVAIYFERASMWEREGDLEKATILFRAANERLPEDVHTAVHLAALLAPSEGVKLLEPLSKTSEDPDLMAELGVLQNLFQEKSGDAAIATARARFDDAMTRMPTAYADHAGWFWLGVGADPVKALAAAEQNLAIRRTSEAYELVIAAASANQRRETACAHAAAARAIAYPSVKLLEKIRQLGCPAETPPNPASAASSARSAP